MTKPELGTKRLCPSCGAKYYDLNRDPITCPKCGTIFEIVAAAPARSVAAPKSKPKPAEKVAAASETEEDEVDPNLVSLEEADEEAAGGTSEADSVDDEEFGEIDTDIDDSADDDTFLEDDEEEGDDVSDLIVDVKEDDDQ